MTLITHFDVKTQILDERQPDVVLIATGLVHV